MATYTDLIAFVLSGDPGTTANPIIQSLTNVDIIDTGDGPNDTSAAFLEESSFMSSFEATIDGVVYTYSGGVGNLENLDISTPGAPIITGHKVNLFAENGDEINLFFIANGNTIPSDINYGVDRVDAGGIFSGGRMEYSTIMSGPTMPLCFTAGTIVSTSRGAIAIEELQVGDLVQTLDHGFQPVRWIDSMTLTPDRARATPSLFPIKISRGTLGSNIPDRDIIVSPQHRILISSKIAERMFGDTSMLVPAKDLIDLKGVEPLKIENPVEYIHILFDSHEIIETSGLLSEALYLGDMSARALSHAARQEIMDLFPDILDAGNRPKPARSFHRGKRVRKMVERHIANASHVFDPSLSLSD